MAKYEVVGQDTSEVIKRLAQDIYDQGVEAEENAKRQCHQYAAPTDEIWCLAKEDSGRFYLCSVANIPGTHSTLNGVGQSIQSAEVDLRYRLAQTYQANQLCKTWDECRHKAAAVSIQYDRADLLIK